MATSSSKPSDVTTACSEIDFAITKTKYLIGRLTEEDVDKESVIDGVINIKTISQNIFLIKESC